MFIKKSAIAGPRWPLLYIPILWVAEITRPELHVGRMLFLVRENWEDVAILSALSNDAQ